MGGARVERRASGVKNRRALAGSFRGRDGARVPGHAEALESLIRPGHTAGFRLQTRRATAPVLAASGLFPDVWGTLRVVVVLPRAYPPVRRGDPRRRPPLWRGTGSRESRRLARKLVQSKRARTGRRDRLDANPRAGRPGRGARRKNPVSDPGTIV